MSGQDSDSVYFGVSVQARNFWKIRTWLRFVLNQRHRACHNSYCMSGPNSDLVDFSVVIHANKGLEWQRLTLTWFLSVSSCMWKQAHFLLGVVNISGQTLKFCNGTATCTAIPMMAYNWSNDRFDFWGVCSGERAYSPTSHQPVLLLRW